jgi:hypothetical protein
MHLLRKPLALYNGISDHALKFLCTIRAGIVQWSSRWMHNSKDAPGTTHMGVVTKVPYDYANYICREGAAQKKGQQYKVNDDCLCALPLTGMIEQQ